MHDITVDRTGDTTSIEIPNCELPKLDGLFGGEVFEDFPFDLDSLFDGLEKELEDAAIN